MKKAGAVIVVGCAVVKAAQITVNDDWDGIAYIIKKTLKKSFESNTMRDVRINFNDERVKVPKVVILGTGWGAMSFLQSLDQDEVDITVISPRSFFFYTPLLAGTAVGTVRSTSIMEPIRWYFNRAGHSAATFIQASCSTVDIKRQIVHGLDMVGGKIEIDYDYLVVAVGAEPATFGISGVRENSLFMKEVDDGVKVQRKNLQLLEEANGIIVARKRAEEKGDYHKLIHGLSELSLLSKKDLAILKKNKSEFDEVRNKEDLKISQLLHWVVVGGGPTGVELCAEMSDFVREDVSKYFPELSGRVKISLIEAGDKILGAFDERMSKYALATLRERGVDVQCKSAVTKITEDYIELRTKNPPPLPIGKMTLQSDGRMGYKETSSIELKKSDVEVSSTINVPYGSLVWAGGIACRPITKAIATEIVICRTFNICHIKLIIEKLNNDGTPQTSRWGLEVDEKLCVRGVKAENIFALGDCAVTGCAPTAQSASQQGKYLGRLFRDTKLDMHALRAYPHFKFVNKGSLAYLGDGKGVAEIRGLWDHYPYQPNSGKVLEGSSAFAIWKSLYFSKLMSSKNQAQVAFDWIQTSLFGRDISTPNSIETFSSQANLQKEKKK